MVRSAVRSLWVEPRVPHPPARVWRDWALVGVLVPAAVLEAIFREDLPWPAFALALGLVSVFALLWRRTHPLLAILVGFGAPTVADIATLYSGDAVLFASVFVLLLPYALCRWGSGRQVMIGLAFMLAAHLLSEILDANWVEALVGIPFLLFPAALGASVRYRAGSKLRETDQVKLREREQLARELHDTVAHHVSAIAIQAQAGRALAASRPAAAVDALRVIEAEASRTLAEMRALVGALRLGEEPDLAPQRGVADIEQLAAGVADGPRVDVELAGDLDDLRPLVEAAIYRLAQESITNAVRHARHATRVSVSVTGGTDSVRLTVRDDGDAGPAADPSSGYGLIGMTERATLLGGTLEAGPSPESGWTVDAVLPRNGRAT